VSTEQRENLDAILRQSAFPPGSDVNEQRRQLRELISAQPLPADVTVTAAALGGVPTAEITIDGIEPRHVVLYFNGGVYVIGDAFQAADLASQVGRRTRAKVISVDYRLAPEHPYPAAVDDALAAYEALLHNGIAPSDIAFAGESAGGGLAIATLVNARDHGLPCRPRPSSCHRMPISPWPGGAWKRGARSTRCSTGNASNPESPTIRRGKMPLSA
jgi:monoterpene epsilon-lactone hydrolase